jgi:hypothetical protein
MTTAERTRYAIDRPDWAEEIVISDDLNSSNVLHLWTAPTVAEDDEGDELTVQLRRDDDLKVDGECVVYLEGEPTIFLAGCDTGFRSTVEARRFAAAIIEACDRWDGAR